MAVSILLPSFFIIILKIQFQGLNWTFDQLSEYGAGAVGCLIVVYRGWTLILKKTKIKKLLQNLELIFPLKYDEQRNYKLHIYAKEIIKKNNLFKSLLSNICALMALIPVGNSIYRWVISNEEYQFQYPFVAWNPFGNSSFSGYVAVYCFQATSVLGGAYIWFNDDVINATCVSQLCMHYRYLGDTLSKLDCRNEIKTSKKLVGLVRYQYYLDSVCNQINEIYSLSNFFAFNCVRIYACMFLFSLINSHDYIKTPTCAMQLFALTLSVYLRCSIGVKLFDASSSLLYSIYDQNWFEGTPRYRKFILIMMIKANRPMKLQASKLRIVSMEYFKEIIVSSYEIFMFLYNFTKYDHD